MANQLGALIVSLGLDAAEYVKGWTKAEYQAKKSLDEIKATVTKVAGVLGVGIGVNAFADMIKGAIEGEAQLEELGKRAGLSGEQLSSLSRAARLSHTDLETVANLSAKLSKTLLESQDSGSKAEAVLRSLGLTSGDTGRLLANPAQALFEIAKQLDKLPEGGTKAAASLFLLGRGGAQVSATLGELAKQNSLTATRTNEEIAAAKELADQFSDMEARSTKLKVTLANALVPTLGDVLKVIEDLATGSGGAQKSLAELAADGSIKQFAQDSVIALATVVESLLLIGRVAKGIPDEFRLISADVDILLKATNAPKLKPFGTLGFTPEQAAKGNAEFDAAVKERERILARMKKDQEDFDNYNVSFLSDAAKAQFAKGKGPPGAAEGNLFSDRSFEAQRAKRASDAAALEKRLRGAIGEAGKGRAGEIQKRELEGQLKAQEDAIRGEQEQLRNREEFLNIYYQNDLISLEAYYAGRKTAADEAIRNTVAAYNKEIDALEAYKKTAKRPEDRIKADTDIAHIIEKRGQAEQEANHKAAVSSLEADIARQKYLDTTKELDAAVLQMTGHEREAAEARFDLQNKSLLAKASLAGDAKTVANIEAMRKQAGAQADLNSAATKYQNTIEELGIAQGRIQLAEQSGAITSLEAIAKRSALAQEYVESLRRQADEQERIAALLVGPEQDAAILKLKRLRLEIDVLAESAHELENQFRNTFIDAFSNNVADAITHTKSFSAAIKDMEKQVVASITRMATRNIGEAIFGKSGPGSGLPNLLSILFGGGAAATGGGGGFDIIKNLFGGGGSLGTGATQGAFIPLGGGFAEGGWPPVGKASWVGEHGPELFVPKQSGQVIPMTAAKRGQQPAQQTLTFNMHFAAGTSRETIEQARLKFGIEVQNAMTRIG